MAISLGDTKNMVRYREDAWLNKYKALFTQPRPGTCLIVLNLERQLSGDRQYSPSPHLKSFINYRFLLSQYHLLKRVAGVHLQSTTTGAGCLRNRVR